MPNSEKFEAASNAAGSGIDQVAAGAHRSVDKLAESLRPTVDRVAAGTRNAMGKMEGTASLMMDKISQSGEQLSNMQDQAVEKCRSGIRSMPLTAIGIAVVTGFLLSRLMRENS